MRQALGKGIGALIPSAPPRPQAESAEGGPGSGAQPGTRGFGREIPVDSIVANPRQPRAHFDPEAIAELAESIRTHGVLQPILVRSLENGRYELIAGERRLRASRAVGIATIPALVKQTAEDDSLVLAIVENVQRAQLSALEEARAYRALLDDFGLTQDAVATRVGKSRPAVANSMRLLLLPDEIQLELEKGNLTPGHARALLALDGDTARTTLGREVVQRRLSVRQTEAAVKDSAAAGKSPRRGDPDLARMESDLGRLLGSKVGIHSGKDGAGKVEIAFYSDDDLARLIDLLGTVRPQMARSARA